MPFYIRLVVINLVNSSTEIMVAQMTNIWRRSLDFNHLGKHRFKFFLTKDFAHLSTNGVFTAVISLNLFLFFATLFLILRRAVDFSNTFSNMIWVVRFGGHVFFLINIFKHHLHSLVHPFLLHIFRIRMIIIARDRRDAIFRVRYH